MQLFSVCPSRREGAEGLEINRPVERCVSRADYCWRETETETETGTGTGTETETEREGGERERERERERRRGNRES